MHRHRNLILYGDELALLAATDDELQRTNYNAQHHIKVYKNN